MEKIITFKEFLLEEDNRNITSFEEVNNLFKEYTDCIMSIDTSKEHEFLLREFIEINNNYKNYKLIETYYQKVKEKIEKSNDFPEYSHFSKSEYRKQKDNEFSNTLDKELEYIKEEISKSEKKSLILKDVITGKYNENTEKNNTINSYIDNEENNVWQRYNDFVQNKISNSNYNDLYLNEEFSFKTKNSLYNKNNFPTKKL